MKWLLLLSVLCIWPCTNSEAKSDTSPGVITGKEVVGRTADVTPVEFNLNGHIFQIPRNYMWMKDQWLGKDGEGGPATRSVYLQVTADTLEPFTEKTASEFHHSNRSKNVLWVNLRVSKLRTFFGAKVLNGRAYKECPVGEHEFYVCPKNKFPHNIHLWSEGLISTRDEDRFFINCEIANEHIALQPDGCQVYFKYKDRLTVHLRCKRHHLSRIREIVANVTERMETFYRGEREPLKYETPEKY